MLLPDHIQPRINSSLFSFILENFKRISSAILATNFASSDGLGFKIKTDKLIAATRSGKKVFNLNENKKAKALTICDKEYLAVTGSNRKMLVFSLSELPELNKGKGVILQRYKDGYLEDIKSISKTDGIIWSLTGGRQRTEKDISGWIGKRGSVGKLVPNGFPRPPKFD